MKKYYIIFCFVLILFATNVANSQNKTDLKVLFISGSSDYYLRIEETLTQKEIEKSVKKRSISFEKLLKRYFTTVKVVKAAEYNAAISKEFDITIFDGTPPVLQEERRYTDVEGYVIGTMPAKYLPDDYCSPTICIAERSSEIGQSFGSKNDWFCLCLYSDALNWDKDHPIFNGPYKVTIKPELKPTPEGALKIANEQGESIPKMVEMWKVQTIDTEKNKNSRIGLVSLPYGYLDSPDAEFISGGVSSKMLESVAIGRHGNFFHWGFAAAPHDMTEEAKIVFINSVIYASQFNQQPIARKFTARSLRTRVDEMRNKVKRETYEKENEHFAYFIKKAQKEIKEKIAKGLELATHEKRQIKMNPYLYKSYAEYLKKQNPQLFYVFGQDEAEYQRYYKRNKPYFHGGMLVDSPIGIEIDEEARLLGIANDDINILDKAISLLEAGEDEELARTILHRYTLCRFEQPSKWRNWFDTYRDKMFFTESSGWLWLVNTNHKNVPGNDYTPLLEEVEKRLREKAMRSRSQGANLSEKESEKELFTDEKNPVALSCSLNKISQGIFEVVLKVKIHSGFHLYAEVSEQEPFLKTEINIELPDGYNKNGEMALPFSVEGTKGTTYYKDEVQFSQYFNGKGEGEVFVRINYQACDNSICFPPQEKQFNLQIK